MMIKGKISHNGGEIIVSLSSYLYKKSNSNTFWRCLQIIYLRLMSCFGLFVMPIESFASFENLYGTTERRVVEKDRHLVSKISTLPFKENTAYERDGSKLYLTICHDFLFAGDSDILVDDRNEVIINDYCYNVRDNILCSDSLLLREKRNVGILRKIYREKPELIESGVMICCRFSSNYYHELFENLNRVLLLRHVGVPNSVPLLVDEAIMKTKSLQSVLNYLADTQSRMVIPIISGKIYRCHNLYFFDHINSIVPHRKKRKTFNLEECCWFDSKLLKEQRNILLQHKVLKDTPKRVFLIRAITGSRNYNEDEIFAVLCKYGFVKVNPVAFTIEEQIAIFNNAEWIIGGSGAAFSNMLFSKSGCKAIYFRASRETIGVSTFSTLAWVNGAELWHYPADKLTNSKGLHSNYYIDPIKFEKILNKLIDNRNK